MSRLTPTSRRDRFIIAGATAVAGGLTMIAILHAFEAGEPETIVMVMSAVLGAGVSGLLFATLFGRRRSWEDLFLTLGAAVLATGLGSFLGGAIWGALSLVVGQGAGRSPPLFEALTMIPQAGGLAFMVVMYMSPAEFPYLLGVWAVLMAGVHAVALLVRRSAERV